MQSPSIRRWHPATPLIAIQLALAAIALFAAVPHGVWASRRAFG